MSDNNNQSNNNTFNTDAIERLSKVETGLVEVKSDVSSIKTDSCNIKENIKEIKEKQISTENNVNGIRELIVVLRESSAKQDETNIYLKESQNYFKTLIEKMDNRQDKYEERTENRYIELLKDNNKQDLDGKVNEISNFHRMTDTILKIITSPIATWIILGGITAYLIYISKVIKL